MTLNQVKSFLIGSLSGLFQNKKVLDKLSENESGNMLYNGEEVGSGKFTTYSPINNAIGNFTSGQEISDEDNMTIVEAINNILHKYVAPTISLSISPTTTLYEVGTTVSSVVATVKITKQTNEIKSVSFLLNGTVVSTVTTDVSNGGTFTYTYTNITSNSMISVRVNDGTDIAKNVVINFAYKQYYGYVADGTSVDDTTIKALQNNRLSTSNSLSYKNITAENSKMVYAYPSTMADLTSILDANGFGYLSSYTKSSITIDDVSYKVYVLTNATTVSNFEQTYK